MISIIIELQNKDKTFKNEIKKANLNIEIMSEDIYQILNKSQDPNKITKKIVRKSIENKYKLPYKCLSVIDQELCESIQKAVSRFELQKDKTLQNIMYLN